MITAGMKVKPPFLVNKSTLTKRSANRETGTRYSCFSLLNKLI